MKTIDLTGEKFGRLTVTKRIGRDKWKHLMWLCKCGCGKEVVVYGMHLVNGRSKSCGCLRKKINRRRKIKPELVKMRTVMNCYKQHAKIKGCSFELTEVQFSKLIKDNCYYCGAEPNNISKRRDKPYRKYLYNGIDRIDNNKGYIINNVVSCCKKCNFAKKTSTLEEFKDWIEKVYNNLIKK